jgi:beta-aspartyl-peptidase (threonine type)
MKPEQEAHYHAALRAALQAGHAILHAGGNALDAVVAAVESLEDCPLFNAGRGAVFTHDGKHELDASVMYGPTRAAGAVAAVQGVRNPVRLARAIMERSEHVFLAGAGAEQFARQHDIPFAPEEYFFTQQRFDQLQDALREGVVQLDHRDDKKFGTVGAVALDAQGNLAAATSTGGMTNKRFGRIGDSPVIGAGTWADNATCAVSCTGHGEFFIRAVAAYDIACLMEYKGLNLQEACETVVMKKLKSVGGEGGLIAVDRTGFPALVFNSEGMYRGWQTEPDAPNTAIYRD